jgi:MinD superfamily P-loop ATPase
MILTVASGKGGTGKTLLSTSLALSLRERGPLLFLDCDVEEPNARFFLKPQGLLEEPAHVLVPEIDKDRCSFCGTCARICAFNALAVLPDDVLVFEDLCHSCGGCSLLCPEKAIREKPKRIGSLYKGETGALTFVEGRLDVGQVLAPPLIREVKRRISGPGITIIDAPPGTSCPVIETARGSDYVLLVTEPTPFGLNDLRLAVNTMRLLGLPCGVILNRSGSGDQQVLDYCTSENIPILLSVPLDREIAAAYSRGLTLASAQPKYIRILQDVYQEIEGLAALASGKPLSREDQQ